VWRRKTRRPALHVGQLLGDPTGDDETLIKSPGKGQVMAATRKADQQHPRAAVTYDEMTKSYFIADGQVFPVASAPASIFRAAVLDQAPEWKSSTVLAGKDIDLVSRWWLLCELSMAGRPMTLYGSREEAERVLGQPTVITR
jgi:hypothetical protein